MAAGDGEGGLGGLTENQLATLDASLERAAKLEQKMKEIAEARHHPYLRGAKEILTREREKWGESDTSR